MGDVPNWSEVGSQSAVIKVVGVGGGGGNAVAHMVQRHVEGVDCICANTDAQALKNSGAKYTRCSWANVIRAPGAAPIRRWVVRPPGGT